MKKIFLSLLTFCALTASAQSEIETFSVYDVNHDAVVTVEDVSKVVNHAMKANADSPQTVDAAALNTLLQSIDNRLARIEEKLGIVSVQEEDPEKDTKDEHEWVDLGLPSGTLWATCNIGAESPEDYGDYFAWGEVEPKSTYVESTYNYSYYNNSSVGKTELNLEDDAAYMNWGEGWRMPSINQLYELYNGNNTNNQWTTLNGKKGLLISSKSNGASLFLPAAGQHYDGSLQDVGLWGVYLSRSLSTSNYFAMYTMDFSSDSSHQGHHYRFSGHSIRPVRVSSQN